MRCGPRPDVASAPKHVSRPPVAAPAPHPPHPLSLPQQGRVYIAITSRNYASRYLYSAEGGSGGAGGHRGVLSVLQKETTDRFADVSLTAGPNGLNGKLAPILKMLCNEFNDLKSLDKIAGVQAKVDAVTGVMKENMTLAMRNNDRCVCLVFWGERRRRAARGLFLLTPPTAPPMPPSRSIEDIDTKASDLAEGAKKFSTASTSLRNAERWKLIKCVAAPRTRVRASAALPAPRSHAALPFPPFASSAGATP